MSTDNLMHYAKAAASQLDRGTGVAMGRALEAMAKEIIALRKEVDELKQKQG